MMRYFGIDHVVKLCIKHMRLIPIFFLVFILCFLNMYVIFSIGSDQFIDPFIHPNDYFSFLKQINGKEMYLIIQKPTHPDFSTSSDSSLFISTDFTIYDCKSITLNNGSHKNITLYGKIVSTYGENQIDFIAYSFWMYCKDCLNPYQLLEKE